MNKKILILAVVFGIGSIITVAYASNTTVTNTSVSTTTVNTSDLVASHDVNVTNAVNTKDLTVTGTCNGCGGSGSREGSYSNYNTVVFNGTIDNPGATAYETLFISNNGTITLEAVHTVIMTSSGTAILNKTNGDFGLASNVAQSSLTGLYKVVATTDNSGTVTVIKGESILQTLGINRSQFGDSGVGNAQVAISPNGQYIAVVYENAGNADIRALIFKGN